MYFFQACVLFSIENAPQPPPPLIWLRHKGIKGTCPLEIPKQRAGWQQQPLIRVLPDRPHQIIHPCVLAQIFLST